MNVDENENVMMDKWKYKERYDLKCDNLLRDKDVYYWWNIYIYIKIK